MADGDHDNFTGAHEIADGGEPESKGGGDTARSLVRDDETQPLVSSPKDAAGDAPPLPGTVGADGADQGGDAVGDAKAAPSDRRRRGRSRSKDGRKRGSDKDGRRRRKRKDKDRDRKDRKGRRRKRDKERIGSKFSMGDAAAAAAGSVADSAVSHDVGAGAAEAKGHEAASTQRDSLPLRSPQGTASPTGQADDNSGSGAGGSEAGSDRPLLDGNAEVLRIHVDDDADFHGAAKHDIHDDDFENEDAKFAANILHKQAAAEEEEEVYEGLEAGDEDMAWVPPSVHRAQVHRKKRLFERGVAPVWNTQLSELGVMGAGIPLYFRLLKYLASAFLIMTFLSAPIWFFSAVGSGLAEEDTKNDAVGWSALTIGNARTGAAPGVNATHALELALFGGSATGKEVSYAIMMSDLCMALFFIGFIFFVRHKVDRVIQETDANNVTTGDYSVMVQGLPDDATQDEIRRHFSELFQLADPDWNFEGHLFGWFMKKDSRPPQDLEDSGDIQDGEFIMPEDPVDPCRPIADVSNSQDAQYLGSWVSEVAMAYENGASLRAYLNARELANELRTARAKVKKYALDTPHPDGPNEKKRLKALQAVDRLESRIEKLKRVCTYNTSKVVAAYVIFNHEESYLRCLEDYEGSGWFWWRFWQPPPLRFRRLHALHVQAAPEPSNVLWEHLDTPYLSRMARLAFTGFLSFMLLVGSFFAILYAQNNKELFAAVIPPDDLCNIHLPAALYGQYFSPEYATPTLIRDRTPGICENARHNYIAYDLNASAPGVGYNRTLLKGVGLLNGTNGGATEFHGLFDWQVIDPATNATVTPPSPCNNPCVAPDDVTLCEPLSCHSPRWEQLDARLACPRKEIGNYSVQMLVNCYCLQEMTAYRESVGWTSWFTVWFSQSPLCDDFVKEWGLAQALPFLAPLAVVFINALLKLVLTRLARFERHHSTSSENAAVAFKVFLFQFINTALVTLVVFARMPNGVQVPGQSTFNYFSGEFDDFTTKWYIVVASSLTLTMFLNTFTAHAPILAKKWVVLPLKRKLLLKSRVTQRQLNLLLEGADFQTQQRFPIILNALFVTMFYCGGLPVLIPLAALNFTLMFWIDKWLLLRFYNRPPYQDQALAVMAQNLLPIALILHLAISSWMYGNSEVLESDVLNTGQLLDPNAPRGEGLDFWLNETKKWDDLGIAPKVVRHNVAPLAALCALVLTVVLVAKVAGRLVKSLTLKFLRCLLCGYCLTKRIANPDRNYVPPYTEVYERELDPRFEHELMDQEVAQGWILNTDTEGRQWVAKQWLTDGTTDGIPHYQGQKKRTWEVIRDNDLETYEMTENEVYADFAVTAKRQPADGDDAETGMDSVMDDGDY